MMQEAISLIDTILLPLMQAADEDRLDEATNELIELHAQPVIRRIIRAKLQEDFQRVNHLANHQEADDLYSEVVTQLLFELRRFRRQPQSGPINHFSGFVARLTLNACYQHLRAKYPQRNSLKNKIRYLLTHQSGLAIWRSPQQDLIGGYQIWLEAGIFQTQSSRQQSLCADPKLVVQRQLSGTDFLRLHPSKLLSEIFNIVGHPLELDLLVGVLAELWGIQDQVESIDAPVYGEEKSAPDLIDPRADVGREVEYRLYLRQLWEEVCALPVRQRTALLLHLRDEQGNSVVPLLPALGIVSIVQIAVSLELNPLEFARVWYDLPLDDNRIAELLGIARQQVINLRKSARERLTRRMKKTE